MCWVPCMLGTGSLVMSGNVSVLHIFCVKIRAGVPGRKLFYGDFAVEH